MSKANQNKPNLVGEILRKIEEKADTGEYIYRGEPERHEEDPYFGKISSNFYREFLKDDDFDVAAEYFDIEAFQEVMLTSANKFSRKPISEP